MCVRERERERNNKHKKQHILRYQAFSDGMGPVEVERRIVVVEENKCTARI